MAVTKNSAIYEGDLDITEGGVGPTGVWTPTVTIITGTFDANPAIVKAWSFTFGNTEWFTIKFTAERSGAAATSLRFSLPPTVSSNFASTADVQGGGNMTDTGDNAPIGTLILRADTANDEIIMNTNSGDTAPRNWQFQGSFLII